MGKEPSGICVGEAENNFHFQGRSFPFYKGKAEGTHLAPQRIALRRPLGIGEIFIKKVSIDGEGAKSGDSGLREKKMVEGRVDQ